MPEQEAFENVGSKLDLQQESDDEDFLPSEPKPTKKHPFQCEICDKILSAKQSLQFHMLTHEDVANRKTLRCEICEATFMSQRGLKKHLQTQHLAENERERLPCPTCGRIFKSAEGRKIHMTIQHGAGGPIFKCKECPMVFARKPHLDLHMATHGSGLHVCTICGKSYARLKDLSRHEAYCGVKELCCSVCGKQLRTAQALESHQKKCRSRGGKMDHGVDEKRGRPKKRNSDGDEVKTRTRRSKYDLFIGLEHLADPSALVAEVEPAKVEPPKLPQRINKRFPCEHCPLKFAGKIALQNHGQRVHWQALGLAEPAAEKRGRPKKRSLERVPKKIGRPRKVVNFDHIYPEELPDEVESVAAGKEKDYPVKAEELTVDDVVENVVIPEANEPNIVYVEEKQEVINQIDDPTPVEPNEATIKEEIIEFEDYKFGHPEGESAEDDNVEEESFELDATDLQSETQEWQDKVDTLAVEPGLEINVSDEPVIFNDIVIKLKKLDYPTLVKPSSNKKKRVREHGSTDAKYRCEDCDKSFNREWNFKAHNKRVHGIVEDDGPNSFMRSCKHCGQKFKFFTRLVKHLRHSHGETIDKSQFVKCPSCRKRFLSEEEMKEHVCDRKWEQKKRSFQCDLCHRAYSSLFYLEAHYPVHPEYQKFKCGQCSKLFFKASALENHERNIHDPLARKILPFKSKFKNPLPRTECEHCGKTFAHQYHLARHRVTEHGSTEAPVARRQAPKTTLPRNFHCDQCDKSYHVQTILAIHKAKIHGVGEAPPKDPKLIKHTCKHCKKILSGWGALVYHLKFAHGETIDKSQIFQCPSCRGKFITEEEMAQHFCLKGIAREKERPFKCDLCDKTYAAKSQLEGHYSVHPEFHNVKCDQCPREFFNKSGLNRHKRIIHKAEESYVECNTCNKRFKSERNLKCHREAHTDNAPYFCEQCGKKFKVLLNLKHHLRSAHVARAIPCTVCGKMFRTSRCLKRHMYIHSNDRRFNCSFPSCGKVFIRSITLKLHEQTHTKDYRHKCKFCEYGTVVRKSILLHEQRVHNHNRFAEVNDS